MIDLLNSIIVAAMFVVGWLLWVRSKHLKKFRWLLLLVGLYLVALHARNLWLIVNHRLLEKEVGLLFMLLAVVSMIYHFLV